MPLSNRSLLGFSLLLSVILWASHGQAQVLQKNDQRVENQLGEFSVVGGSMKIVTSPYLLRFWNPGANLSFGYTISFDEYVSLRPRFSYYQLHPDWQEILALAHFRDVRADDPHLGPIPRLFSGSMRCCSL